MKYPVVVTSIGSDYAMIADNQSQRDDRIAIMTSEGYQLEDIVCFELGTKWDFAGYMFSNTPFPVKQN